MSNKKSKSLEIPVATENFAEANSFIGATQNLINVTGDVVTVAIEEKYVWKEQNSGAVK